MSCGDLDCMKCPECVEAREMSKPEQTSGSVDLTVDAVCDKCGENLTAFRLIADGPVNVRPCGTCTAFAEPEYQEPCPSCYGIYPVGVNHVCPD